MVVQRSDGGSGLITILVVIAAIFVIAQVATNFGGGDDAGEYAIRGERTYLASVSVWCIMTATVFDEHSS